MSLCGIRRPGHVKPFLMPADQLSRLPALWGNPLKNVLLQHFPNLFLQFPEALPLLLCHIQQFSVGLLRCLCPVPLPYFFPVPLFIFPESSFF